MPEYTTYVPLHTAKDGVIRTPGLNRLCDQISNEENYD